MIISRALASDQESAHKFPCGLSNEQFPRPIVSSPTTVDTPKLLTPEEFASLIEIAITSPTPTVPPPHLAKLISLGYVIVTSKGPLVTGDGLIRITESE